jgi:hypothetical protein
MLGKMRKIYKHSNLSLQYCIYIFGYIYTSFEAENS